MRRAASGVLEFAEALPEGLDAKVGDNGGKLSGGSVSVWRWQGRCTAADVLLDEATSALDASSESLVQQALEQAVKGKTVVVIAHRMSTIRKPTPLPCWKGPGGGARDARPVDGAERALRRVESTAARRESAMFVSGFTFINNAVRFDYPIVEAIQSIMPLCDEVVVAVGDAQDGTRELIESIGSNKVWIVDTVWDHSLREGGGCWLWKRTRRTRTSHLRPTGRCTSKATRCCTNKTCRPSVKRWNGISERDVDGLLFKYKHFYGSYDYVRASDRWYAPPSARGPPGLRGSRFETPKGFASGTTNSRVLPVDATVHHYGWVKPPQVMQDKRVQFNKLWHDDEWVETHVVGPESFAYESHSFAPQVEGPHPQVMQRKVAAMNWTFSFDPSQNRWTWKERMKSLAKRWASTPTTPITSCSGVEPGLCHLGCTALSKLSHICPCFD